MLGTNFIESESKYIYQTYGRFPLVVDRAEGCYIYDKNGNKYLDFLAGIAVNALGHSHPKILSAIEQQYKRYLHISNYFYQDIQIELAEALCRISGYDNLFFCNSGTEATEGAIKIARKWGFSKNKKEIIAFSGGFHGRSYGALSIMDKPKYKENMGPYLDFTKVIPLNQIEYLYQNINSDTLAVVIEFIQGEGGIAEPTNEFIEVILELKEQYNFLIIADEVQCGTGRSGKFFAFDYFNNIHPEIVTMAKGIGGGLPLGAILFDKSMGKVWTKGNHGTTYGGNALACATGKVVIDELNNGLLDSINSNGLYFKNELLYVAGKFSDIIAEVRGKGLMLGLLLKMEAQVLVDKLFTKKVITNAASGNVLRIVPPLIVTKDEIDLFIKMLVESLLDIHK